MLRFEGPQEEGTAEGGDIIHGNQYPVGDGATER